MNLVNLPGQVREMISNHPFWALLTLAVLIWYSLITVFVAIRGAMDIKQMLRNLATHNGDSTEGMTNDEIPKHEGMTEPE